MPRYIAFLRAINVGGHTVPMAELRRLFESLSFEDVETFIASGNVVFSARRGPAKTLEAKIESCLRDALGYELKTFLRTEAEVAAVAVQRPFSKAHHAAATAFCVGFLHEPLDAAGKLVLAGLESEVDAFQCVGREVYWLCRLKQSESKFSGGVFERLSKRPITFRGMNTVQRIAAKYPPGE